MGRSHGSWTTMLPVGNRRRGSDDLSPDPSQEAPCPAPRAESLRSPPSPRVPPCWLVSPPPPPPRPPPLPPAAAVAAVLPGAPLAAAHIESDPPAVEAGTQATVGFV